jgi:hypothetical protein
MFPLLYNKQTNNIPKTRLYVMLQPHRTSKSESCMPCPSPWKRESRGIREYKYRLVSSKRSEAVSRRKMKIHPSRYRCFSQVGSDWLRGGCPRLSTLLMDGGRERKESECCEKHEKGEGLSLGESELYLSACAETLQ